MGEVVSITKHKNYKPHRVRALAYYTIDPNLSDTAREIYRFLCLKAQQIDGTFYNEHYQTVTETLEGVQEQQWGREQSETNLKLAITQLRKLRYIRYIYLPELAKRVVELPKFIGSKV